MMNWVEQRYQDEEQIDKHRLSIWAEFRDCVMSAVDSFIKRYPNSPVKSERAKRSNGGENGRITILVKLPKPPQVNDCLTIQLVGNEIGVEWEAGISHTRYSFDIGIYEGRVVLLLRGKPITADEASRKILEPVFFHEA